MEKKKLFNQIYKGKGSLFFKFFLGSLIKKGSRFRALTFLKFLVKNFKQENLSPLFFFEYIICIAKPVMSLKDYYAGRTKYRIPYFIYGITGFKIGFRWLIKNANLRKEKLFKLKLFKELFETLSDTLLTRSDKKKEMFYFNIIKNRPFLKHVKNKFKSRRVN